jgi:serine phosphatase RsbU (regulator of sigma subunit)/anti-sigma regulatory factor (Ser/Thr protein kinase)
LSPVKVDTAGGFEVRELEQVRYVRRYVAERLAALGHEDLVDEAQLVVSELTTNALLHAGGRASVQIVDRGDGVRAEVADGTHTPPVLSRGTERTLTGRGLHLVASLAVRWGVTQQAQGKVVWAELAPHSSADHQLDEEELLDAWSDSDSDWDKVVVGEPRYRVVLGDIPTHLLLDAKAHVDNLVREFSLLSAGAASGQTATVAPALARVIDVIVGRFGEARVMIKHQAAEAAREGRTLTRLQLELPASAADAGEDYLRALDEADAYCRAARMLTLETPAQHRVFRQWYVGELVAGLRSAEAGFDYRPVSFQDRLLGEVDRVAETQRAFERAARLYAVAGALARADTPEAVAEAVLTEGVAALGASGGGVLLAGPEDRLVVPGTVGYDAELVARLRAESRDAELPAAVALRTGDPVWMESREERDARFPELIGFERATVSMCAVPLVVGGRGLGALRFSFKEARLFDEDERRFVLALAAQAAQALERSQLHQARIDVSRRLQRSLLPPELPAIPGVDVAAVYNPLGQGVEIGGDFYDMWLLDDDHFAFAIGDVAGNGPEAAAVTARVRSTLRAVTMHEWRPEVVLRNLNEAMYRAAPSNLDTETFCTAVFGVGSADGHTMQMATGGHPHPLVRRADGTVEVVRMSGNLLGALDQIEVGTSEVTLAPGDALVLFTDGVTDARDGAGFFDLEGAVEVLRRVEGPAAAIAAAIEAAVLTLGGGHLEDDMALLVLRARSV